MNAGYESEAKYGRWQTAMLGGVVLLAVLLLINLSLLFFVYAEASSTVTSEELQKELRGLSKSITYYRTQYEQQKVQLYELNNRLTDNEIEMKSRLITLEKAHAKD